MDMDFDELARKTFEISHSKEHQEILNQEKENSSFEEEELSGFAEEQIHDIYETVTEEGLPLAPAGPGLLFKIEKGTQTYCIRGFSTECIEQSLLDVESGEVTSRAKLKFNGEEDFDHLNFFEMATVDLAARVQSNLFNRRFPINEALVCNLSDPGFSWWLNDSEDGFEVFFQTYQILGKDQFQRIGPIGDHYRATDIFRAGESALRKFFPINEFSCDDKSLKIVPCDPENIKYQQFLDLLYRGDDSLLAEFFPVNDSEEQLYNYLQELSTMRMFWINVEEILSDLE